MGLTPFPSELVLRLATAYGATAFVETGTFHGATAAWAAQHFRVVHTIELGQVRYLATSQALRHLANITFHHGDSRQVLPGVIRALNGERAVYWLDGHWSGPGTDGEADQCPLLSELALLSAEDIILIDDARLFFDKELPVPLDPAQWPTAAAVVNALPNGSVMDIVGDVIFALPPMLRPVLIECVTR